MDPKLPTSLPFCHSALTPLGPTNLCSRAQSPCEAVALIRHVSFFLWLTAPVIPSPAPVTHRLAGSLLTCLPTRLSPQCLSQGVFLHVAGSFCAVLWLPRTEAGDRVLTLISQLCTAQGKGEGLQAAHCECFLLKCFMYLLLFSFSFRYRVKTVSFCLLLPGQSQKLSVTPFIHSVS